MSGIRSTNTNPEIVVRKLLHKEGFRYKLHDKSLPGKPDLVFQKYEAVIQIHGCFWHGHNCHLFKRPSSNVEFWQQKISMNVKRDRQTNYRLQQAGWRVMTIWECAVKGKTKLDQNSVVKICRSWLLSSNSTKEIRGNE